eukprot:3770822-Pleurochrysis_carterae.AAC.1
MTECESARAGAVSPERIGLEPEDQKEERDHVDHVEEHAHVVDQRAVAIPLLKPDKAARRPALMSPFVCERESVPIVPA